MRKLIEDASFQTAGATLTVTVSIGIGTWDPALKDDFEELIRRADAALYRAKEQGRNCVCA